jgi:hypothetical protein
MFETSPRHWPARRAEQHCSERQCTVIESRQVSGATVIGIRLDFPASDSFFDRDRSGWHVFLAQLRVERISFL